MKKFIKSKLVLQAVMASFIAIFVAASIVSATTTIGANISTGGTLTVTGATALNGGLTMDTNKFTVADATGNTAIAGTLTVTGLTTLVNASSTGWIKAATIKSDTGAISFDDDNLTTTGSITFSTASSTGSGVTSVKLNGLTVYGNATVTGTFSPTDFNPSGNASIGGTLTVTGNTVLTTASSTGTVKFSSINSDTGAISFGDETLTTTGAVDFGAATVDSLNVSTGGITNAGAVSGVTTLTASGNLTVDTSTFYVDATNNRVGVGTTTPTVSLHIDDGATATTTIAIGDRTSGTGKSCLDLAASDGTAVRAYIVGTSWVIEAGTCE